MGDTSKKYSSVQNSICVANSNTVVRGGETTIKAKYASIADMTSLICRQNTNQQVNTMEGTSNSAEFSINPNNTVVVMTLE